MANLPPASCHYWSVSVTIGWTAADPAPPAAWRSASASVPALMVVMIVVLRHPHPLLLGLPQLPRMISSFSYCRRRHCYFHLYQRHSQYHRR